MLAMDRIFNGINIGAFGTLFMIVCINLFGWDEPFYDALTFFFMGGFFGAIVQQSIERSECERQLTIQKYELLNEEHDERSA